MLREVDWGELDVLVVDMPPGTGDAQLTMAQQVPLAGAVIVSTPQDLALIDARKGLNMFKQGRRAAARHRREHELFHRARHAASATTFSAMAARAARPNGWASPFLGEVPLEMDIRESSDAGRRSSPRSRTAPQAKIYRDIAVKSLGPGARRTRRRRSGGAEHRVRIGGYPCP